MICRRHWLPKSTPAAIGPVRQARANCAIYASFGCFSCRASVTPSASPAAWTARSMRHDRHSSIEADPTAVERCERRYALSASPAAEWLLANLGNAESVDMDAGEPVPNLLDQAAELRDTRSLDGSGQTVAVIDSGVAWDHIALGGNFGPGYRVVGGWDFAESDPDPYDDGPAGFHGTHVAALLAGHSEQFAGVAPGADVVALRVLDDQGRGELEWIESALRWVHDHRNAFDSPITTVNLSLGADLSERWQSDASAMLSDELEQLRSDNILVFAAAGNRYDSVAPTEALMFPASHPDVVAVSSAQVDGRLSAFAQREPGVLASLGESVRSAVPDHVYGWDGRVDDFAALDGTSMATPQVAAASMLVRQAMIEQGLSPTADDVLVRIRAASVAQFDPEVQAGYQLVDLHKAVGFDSPVDGEPLFAHYQGTDRTERVTLDLRDGIELQVGDESLRGDSTVDTPLLIDAGGGDDRLHVIGSALTERLVLNAGTLQGRLTIGEQQIEIRNFEQVTFEGGGGADRATLFDSAGNDTLESHPDRATLSGVGYQFQILGVPRSYMHGTAGGNDTAFLYDSAGDDQLSVRPQFTSLRTDRTFQLAYGYERVYAYATAGFDSAELSDSAGDDTMSISSDRSLIAGPGYKVSARGFDSVVGHANSGGDDVARIYVTESGGRWDVAADRIQWTNAEQLVRTARGFEQTAIFENAEPVPLEALLPPLRSDLDDEREADALRRVFEELGAIDSE